MIRNQIRKNRQNSALQGFRQFAIDNGQIEVASEVDKLQTVGLSAIPIIFALAPFILQMLTGQPIDWRAVLSALADLLD